jgi:mono/diheme cytochrome c family protein
MVKYFRGIADTPGSGSSCWETEMRPTKFVGTLLVFAATAVAAICNAQEQLQPTDQGKLDFEADCAMCHGADGKGDGSYARSQQLKTPDLTLLTARNRGVFPYRRVAAIIDGRHGPVIHGIPGMPIWGDRYKAMAAAECRHAHCDPKAVVRARVRALTEYIRRLNSD